MRCLVRHEGDSSALHMILTVVANPCLTEHLMAEPEFIIGPFVIIRVFREGSILWHFKAMRRRAHADHGTTAVQIIIEVLHLLRGEVLEAQKHHREVGGVQRLDARHV